MEITKEQYDQLIENQRLILMGLHELNTKLEGITVRTEIIDKKIVRRPIRFECPPD